MPRNLDTTLATHLGDQNIQPCVFVQLKLKSGVVRVWSGVGDFIGPDGQTFTGVGMLGSVGPIGEGIDVKADGTTVTLSGIGDTILDIPGPPVTPPTLSGQYAWSFATNPPGGGIFEIPLWGASGSMSGNLYGGSMSISGGAPIGPPFAATGLLWSGFKMPPEIPADAIITHVYPVVRVSSLAAGGAQEITYTPPGTSGIFTLASGVLQGVDMGPDAVGSAQIAASMQSSLEGAGSIAMALDFVGLAVYYEGTPRTKLSMLQEALGDVLLGAPAKIWFGLMNGPALLGVPYLVFSGLVDKPSVHVGTDTLSITLALENRLLNLQRANQRRYTAADQKIYFPTDMAFNWVESLNDIALRWGN